MISLGRRFCAAALNMAAGRSGTVYKTWLGAQGGGQARRPRSVRGDANALRDGLGDAVAVLGAFHIVKLGTQVMDEVRRRVQQDTLHRRGHRDDPLYKIRGLLRQGADHLSDRQIARPGPTLRAWRVQVLTYLDTSGVSTGGTEAINGIIEKTRRLGHGYRNLTNCRLRMLLAAKGHRHYRRARPAKP